jgi:stearoyl-CoA desaturase (Delta-9 desaturase)
MHDQPASKTDIVYPSTAAFLSVHLACLAALITGITMQALILGIALYWVRIFSIGAGYHRYFAHRSFKTSRLFQFCLGLLSQTSAQCGVLWWAEKHRQHHRYSDTDQDMHSPHRHGVLYAHVGWIFVPQHAETDYRVVRDLYRFPELRWLDPTSLSAGRRVCIDVLAHGRLAWAGCRFLLEHGRCLACDIQH